MNQHTQIQTKPETSTFSSSAPLAARTNLLQRQCACGGTPGLDGECAECRRERLLGSGRNLSDQADPSGVPPVVHDVLRSPGHPLDASTNSLMTARLGHNFSRVRIHTDARAAESARAVESQAYTVENNVVFGAGQYAPQTRAGRQLLAHELAHTLQQGAAPTHVPDRLKVGEVGSQLEYEADAAAMAVGQGVSAVSPRFSAATPMVQRQSNIVPFDIEKPTPEQAAQNRRLGVQLPRVSTALDPRTHSMYVDRRIRAVGYGIYLGGYLLYCEGLELPIFVSESYVRLGLTNAASVNNDIYPDYDSARATIPYGPWREEDAVPYAYFRAAGGASPLIVPTIFSPSTTPRTVETMLDARRALAEAVQQDLTAVAIGLVGGIALRVAFSVIARVAGGGASSKTAPEPTPTTPSSRAPTEPTPRPTRQQQKGPGSQRASVRAENERRAMRPEPTPVPATQQTIRNTLLGEHPGLHPNVATEAAKGGARAMGPGGAGADVPLLNGGGREVSVHRGAFTPQSIGNHLQGEVAQAGTTEVYLQINTATASREGLLRMIGDLRNAYPELRGTFVRFFGPNGETWWNGVFRGPR